VIAAKDTQRCVHIHMPDGVHDCLGLRILGRIGKPIGEVVASDPVLHLKVDCECLAGEEDVEHPSVLNVSLAIEEDPADDGVSALCTRLTRSGESGGTREVAPSSAGNLPIVAAEDLLCRCHEARFRITR
jgi:hypothetical protein